MERAIAGAELLRLAGGPARGWYPKQRHRFAFKNFPCAYSYCLFILFTFIICSRPASIEHLERLPLSASVNQHTGPWDSSRKPLTLPPNLTPKFFHKSPREALRRVTSLLIRKGKNMHFKNINIRNIIVEIEFRNSNFFVQLRFIQD